MFVNDSIIIAAFWLAFLVYWAISAVKAKKNVNGTFWQQRAIPYRLVGAILLIFLLKSHLPYWLPLNWGIFGYSQIKMLGVIFCGLGIALAIWARYYLGANWGMPMSVKQNPELVASGPYKLIRHPIYTGVILAMLGSGLVDGISWLIMFVFFSAYFIYSAVNEEKLMLQQFPGTYPDYKARTKMLIPFIF